MYTQLLGRARASKEVDRVAALAIQTDYSIAFSYFPVAGVSPMKRPNNIINDDINIIPK